MNDLVLSAVGFLIPLVSGITTTVIVGSLKKFSSTVAVAPAWVKQTATVVVAATVVGAANILGVEVAGNPFEWNAHVPRETVQALVAALFAHVLHSGRKRDEAKKAAKLAANEAAWVQETFISQ